MLTYLQAIILGALQGISELFPVSSLGHSVIVPQLLGWQLNEQAPFFLMFLVATHFATALVLALFYWRDWVRIISGFFRSLKPRAKMGAKMEEKMGAKTSGDASSSAFATDPDARLAWLIIIGTIPAGLIGLIFKNSIQTYLLSATSAAVFLILNGILLYGAEIVRKKSAKKSLQTSDLQADNGRIAKLSWPRAFWIGIAQSLALIPGFSRSGATFGGGLTAGLSHEDALRFSFLLSTPVIGAAALLELPKLLVDGLKDHALLGIAFTGAIAAALFAYLAVRFLTRYFSLEKSAAGIGNTDNGNGAGKVGDTGKADNTNKERTLTPFAIYCIAAGIISLIFLVK